MMPPEEGRPNHLDPWALTSDQGPTWPTVSCAARNGGVDARPTCAIMPFYISIN